jgi:hypothetical protein
VQSAGFVGRNEGGGGEGEEEGWVETGGVAERGCVG